MSEIVSKIFISKNKTASIPCPECKQATVMDVSKYVDMDRFLRLKFTCKCGHKFPIVLERRKYVRKKVNLKGSIVFEGKECSILIIDIVVIDISRYGLKIKLLNKLNLSLNQKIQIDFELDDKSRSKVSKEAWVRTINGNEIGVEFLFHEHYDKFGAYILFHFNKD